MKHGVFKDLYVKKKKTLAVALNSILRYIEAVLSIKNGYFHFYVDSIYPGEFEKKYTIEPEWYVSYIEINSK